MKRPPASWFITWCLSIGTFPLAIAPSALAVEARATGPRVSDVRLETRDNHQEGRLYEVEDYLTVISARIEPGSGGEVKAADVRVLMHGRPLTVGKRAYDLKTRRFTLTLTTKDVIGTITGETPPPGPAITVIARDPAGREGRGTFTVPAPARATGISLSVVTTDSYGRSVPVDDQAAPPTRPVGTPFSVTPGTLAPTSPLRLRVLKRIPLSPSERLNDFPDGRLSATHSGIDLSFRGAYASLLAPWDPTSGQLGSAVPIFATPSGAVERARREGRHFYSLAWGAGARSFLEATGTGRRMAVPLTSSHRIDPERPVDFVADDRRWVVVGSDGTMLGGEWDGRARWRLNGDQLFPMYIGPHDPAPALARQSDATLMAFFVGEDMGADDDPACAGLAHVGPDGRLLAARMVSLPSQGRGDMGVQGGGAALYRGRRLLVANRLRYDDASKTEVHESVLYDMDSRQATPLLILPPAQSGTLPVYGAAVLGDRLYIGCGPSGIAVVTGQ
jgi:hypothetical protein